MDSYSTSENQFDYNNLLQMTDNTLNHQHHHNHHQNKESLIFEPLNVDFVTNTDIYSASTQQNFDPNQTNNVQIFDSNSEQYYNNASIANTKTYLNNNNNNNYSQNWNYNNSNFGVYQPIDHKLTMMTSVTDYNQQSFNSNNNYDYSIIHQQQQQQQQQSTKPTFYENNNFNQIIKSETFQNFSNYDNHHPYHDPYHNSTNDLVDNSSLSSTPTISSSNNSSPTNNNSITKLELLTHNDFQSQLKTEPFVNVNDYNNNVKTEFNQIPTPTTTPPPAPITTTTTTINEKYFNNEHFFKTEPPLIKQAEKRKLSLTDIKYSVCNVCDDTPPGNANFTNETCEACRVFFRRFSKTSKKISRQPNCNRACVIKRETRGDCLSCRYDKCLAVGMSSTHNEIEYLNNESSLLQKMPIKQMKIESTNTNDDLNLNSASINEIRNLSIEVVLSSSSSVAASAATPNSLSSTSSSSSSACSSFSDSYTDLIRTLFKEIELKKNQIRSENNEHKMKLHLVDLSEKISNCVVNSLKKSSSNKEAFLTLISNCTKQYLNDFKNENKQLLIAYQCLIDNETSFHLATSELRLKSMLNKIYSNLDRNANLGGNKKSSTEFVDTYAGDYPINYGITLTSNYSNLTAEELQAQAFQSKMFTSLTELKVLHFLLLLFSSFQSLDEFIQYDLDLYNNNNNNSKKNKINSSSSTTTTIKTDIAYCQRFLVKLIDRLCHDKIIKTQILLSVSEIDFF